MTTPNALMPYLPTATGGTDPQLLGIYQAQVAATADPLNQQRVRLLIPQVLGNALSNWALPMQPGIVPAQGTAAFAMFLGGDINTPYYFIGVTNALVEAVGNSSAVLNTNPYFIGDLLTGWTSTNGSLISITPNPSTNPPFSYAVEWTGAGTGGGYIQESASTFGAVIGQPYQVQAWVYYAAGGSVNFGFGWTGQPDTITSISVPAGAWTAVNAVGTASAVTGYPKVGPASSSIGSQFIATAITVTGQIPGQIISASSISSGQVNFNARAIGGITTSIQATAPTGAKAGDLWFDSSNNNKLNQYDGTSWNPYQFGTNAFAAGSVTAAIIAANTITAAQIAAGTITSTQIATGTIVASNIQTGTITSSQIASGTITGTNIAASTITSSNIQAGTIVAGIVDGTEIDGALFRVKNSSGATVMTINKSAGTWIQYLDTGTSTQGIPVASSDNAQFTDEFGNLILGGLSNYNNQGGGNYNAVQIFQGNVNFLNSSSLSGPWNVYTSLEPDTVTGLLAYFDNAGNYFAMGTKTTRTTGTVTINSTSPIVILSSPNIETIQYYVHICIVYEGGATAANAGIGWDGSVTVSNTIGVIRRGRGSTNVDNVLPVNTNGPPGLLSLAFNANELCTYEFDGMITFSVGGTFSIRGQEGTSGDTWAVGTNSFMNMTPVH